MQGADERKTLLVYYFLQQFAITLPVKQNFILVEPNRNKLHAFYGNGAHNGANCAFRHHIFNRSPVHICLALDGLCCTHTASNTNRGIHTGIIIPMPIDEQRKTIEDELKRNWVVLASLAWKGYKDNGRGFLVLDELPPKRIRYVYPKEGTSPKKAENEIDYWLPRYNPRKQVIVAVKHQYLDDVRIFCLSHWPYPPKAYEIRRRALKDGSSNT